MLTRTEAEAVLAKYAEEELVPMLVLRLEGGQWWLSTEGWERSVTREQAEAIIVLDGERYAPEDEDLMS